jgi:hypothetical protein
MRAPMGRTLTTHSCQAIAIPSRPWDITARFWQAVQHHDLFIHDKSRLSPRGFRWTRCAKLVLWNTAPQSAARGRTPASIANSNFATHQ